MESADNECEGMDSADKVEEELELPQAPDLQEFLVNPTKYRPRAEYLYPGFLIEVCVLYTLSFISVFSPFVSSFLP